MNIVLDKKENNKVSFTVEIDAKDFSKAVQGAYLKNRKYFNLPGFRKGKAPRQIIEMNYGPEVFYEDAINEILPEAYEKAIDELKLEPVDQPEVDIEEIVKDENVIAKFEVEVKPEVKLGDYKGLEVEKVSYELTDEVVENELKSVQDMNGRLIDAGDRSVENGDVLTIDYSGSVDGELFPGGTAEGQPLTIGSEQFIPGFEEQLIGKNKGEEVEVKVTFPEEYHAEELAGKEAIFKVTIHEVKVKELPELDDEFAKDVSEFDTLEEYKNDIRAKLEEEFKNREKVEQENLIVEKVVEISEVEVPEGMIKTQIDNEVSEFAHRLSSQGLSLDQYISLIGGDEQALRDQLRPMAADRVKGDLILEAVAEAENIVVEDEDIEKELVKMAEIYNQENVEKFVEDMKKGDLSFLDGALKNQKVIDFLMGEVKLV